MNLFFQPLFNQRFLRQRIGQQPTPIDHKKILHDWAAVIRSGAIHKQKETEVRGPFIQRFFIEILGYRPIGSGGQDWTINDEKRTGSGSADTALGFFNSERKHVIAPVELKGANTRDLDAIMPGRHKSPVMQAWEYAMDTPGCEFLLVSNMVEIRLYAVGHTRQVFERFDVLDLADSDSEYWRFRQLLSAERLLTGETSALLKQSGLAEKEITRQLYTDYKSWRINLLIALLQNTGRSAETLIEPVQKLLDRVLFIAFAEDRSLLPPKSLANAWKHRDPYNPRPIWENFLGLFRAIDKGNPQLGIPAYNGGLFAPDPILDKLPISDESCRMFDALGEYDFADDVSVTVLGHIFEQSISDLEHLKELACTDKFSLGALESQLTESNRSVSGKRKNDGVVYTPDAVTRLIVDQTLGTYLSEKQMALRSQYCKEVAGADVWRKPTKDETSSYTGKGKQAKLKNTERLVEFLFWSAWRAQLCEIRVVDPACGSGAFLVAAFDLLDTEYRRANEQIQAITGNPDLFDVNREILNGNLYGVDLNPESIEITKLSLWLKTAQYGKPLQSLEANLRIGNSLITDSKFTTQPFDWQKAFPKVFADGGFDVVLGNPPYVRMERLKEIKPYLEQHYTVASDRADLYNYFYELGLSLLKPAGRLGYISSSTFFKTRSGEPLRRLLLEKAEIKTLIDFGELQLFEGVTTYPAIVVLDRSSAPSPANEVQFLVLDTMPDSLAADLNQHAKKLPQSQLSDDSWRLENDLGATIFNKVKAGRKTLKELFGSPLYGIKSGLERAFSVNQNVRKKIISEDPKSSDLLKPYIEGKDVKSWCLEARDLWLIYIPKNKIDIDTYPGIKSYLMPFKSNLEKRATKQSWFELQQPQERYAQVFSGRKIVYPDIADRPRFSLDDGSFLATTCFCIDTSERWVVGYLNSNLAWWIIQQKTPRARGGFRRLKSQYMEEIPFPEPNSDIKNRISNLAESAQSAAQERRNVVAAFRRRILTDLAPGGASAKLSSKLGDWPELTFKSFHDEVKKQFKTTIPLDEREAWQVHFEKESSRVAEFSAEIKRCERAINAEVYQLFSLTSDEIALIEASVK